MIKFTKTLLRNPIISRSLQRIPKFQFARDLTYKNPSLSTAEQNLSNEIKKQYQDEEVSQERERYIKNFLIVENWEMDCNENTTRIVLSKTQSPYSVKVFYDAKYIDTSKGEVDEGSKGSESTELASTNRDNELSESQLEDYADEYFEFMVLIEKKSENAVLLDCVIVEGEVLINGINISADVKDILHKKLTNSYLYQGPKIATLDEPLQEKLYAWIVQMGINNQFGTFLEESAYHHENKLYRKFLEKFDSFLNN